MPFQLNYYTIDTPQKAFLFLIRVRGYTQKEAQKLIANGRLFIDEVPVLKSDALLEGKVALAEFVPKTQGLLPIFETEAFALFDKPSGLLVHPSSRYTPYSLIDEVKFHFGMNANIVHRIDQETSGLILAARTKKSEKVLKMLFETRGVLKEYLALVEGKIDAPMLIDAPIDRYHDQDAVVKIMMRIDPNGKPSQTEIEPLKYFEKSDKTLILARPRTGRQHQIRIHLFHVKHPIVGDPLYHVPLEIASDFLDKKLSSELREMYSGASRLLLHAHRLRFEYQNKTYNYQSQVDFEALCKELIDIE